MFFVDISLAHVWMKENIYILLQAIYILEKSADQNSQIFLSGEFHAEFF